MICILADIIHYYNLDSSFVSYFMYLRSDCDIIILATFTSKLVITPHPHLLMLLHAQLVVTIIRSELSSYIRHVSVARPGWEECAARARRCVRYVRVYGALLAAPAAALPADAKRAKDEVEWDTPLHTLRALREVTMRKVPKSSPAESPEKPGGSGRSMLVHWFPQWWGWYAAPEPPAPTPTPTPAPPARTPLPELEEEILDVLADSLDNDTVLKRDTVFGKFEFELLKGSLNLYTEEEPDKRKRRKGGRGVAVRAGARGRGVAWARRRARAARGAGRAAAARARHAAHAVPRAHRAAGTDSTWAWSAAGAPARTRCTWRWARCCCASASRRARCSPCSSRRRYGQYVGVECRGRAGAHALHVALGALLLRERVTPRTLFPVLIAPQVRTVRGRGVARARRRARAARGAGRAAAARARHAAHAVPRAHRAAGTDSTWAWSGAGAPARTRCTWRWARCCCASASRRARCSPCSSRRRYGQYVGVEWRGRAGAHALRVALDALLLRERVTPRTLFPVLIAPQVRTVRGRGVARARRRARAARGAGRAAAARARHAAHAVPRAHRAAGTDSTWAWSAAGAPARTRCTWRWARCCCASASRRARCSPCSSRRRYGQYVGVEWRGRAGAHALHVALGALLLRERVTPRTLFPVLIAPQVRTVRGRGVPRARRRARAARGAGRAAAARARHAAPAVPRAHRAAGTDSTWAWSGAGAPARTRCTWRWARCCCASASRRARCSPCSSRRRYGQYVGVEWRGRAGAHALHVALGALLLRERVTPRTLFPVLIAPQVRTVRGRGVPRARRRARAARGAGRAAAARARHAAHAVPRAHRAAGTDSTWAWSGAGAPARTRCTWRWARCCCASASRRARCSPCSSRRRYGQYVGVEWRGRAGAHALHVALGALLLRERVTPRTLFPVLIAPQVRTVRGRGVARARRRARAARGAGRAAAARARHAAHAVPRAHRAAGTDSTWAWSGAGAPARTRCTWRWARCCCASASRRARCSPCSSRRRYGQYVGVEWRGRAGAHALHVALGALLLRERVTPRTLFPVLIAPQVRTVRGRGVARARRRARAARGAGRAAAARARHAAHAVPRAHRAAGTDSTWAWSGAGAPARTRCTWRWARCCCASASRRARCSPCSSRRRYGQYVGVEWRGRAGAHALHVALGALLLRERVTPRTLFPVLIAPQVRTVRGRGVARARRRARAARGAGRAAAARARHAAHAVPRAHRAAGTDSTWAWSGAGAHALHVALGALLLRERVTPRTLFPVLIAPQGTGCWRQGAGAADVGATSAATAPAQEPLFQLSYERKPFGSNADHKLWVKSSSLEVVYSGEVVRWAREFVRAGAAPGGAAGGAAGAAGAAGEAGEAAPPRRRARDTLSRRWAHMMRARDRQAGSWQVELDVRAPQIVVAERPTARAGALLLLDFGRLRLANAPPPCDAAPAASAAPSAPDPDLADLTDDDETFATPCSTPPGSLQSPASPRAPPAPLDAARLHCSLYDRYNIELSDLQILVGRVRDNWKYAHTKTTSSLHLLDRFSISLQAERRLVATSDPQYPWAALCGSLPALVAHLSEHKLAALRAVLCAVPPAPSW
ncbi:hypothetical protein ACJJTC_007624 [Scirpophaga incertulas]